MDKVRKELLRESLENALDAQRYRALRFFICADAGVQEQVGIVMQGVVGGHQQLSAPLVDKMVDEAVLHVRFV